MKREEERREGGERDASRSRPFINLEHSRGGVAGWLMLGVNKQAAMEGA